MAAENNVASAEVRARNYTEDDGVVRIVAEGVASHNGSASVVHEKSFAK